MASPRVFPATVGLVLTGGGARAAYQAGVMNGIREILGNDKRSGCDTLPFRVLTGISAGAINTTYLASHADRFTEGVESCTRLWRELKAEQVIRTDMMTLSKLSARWIRNLSFGGAPPAARATHLIDASPLRQFLQERIDYEAIRRHLASGCLRGVAVSATNYQTGTAVSFFDGDPSIESWTRSSRIGMRDAITASHVLASSAIPLLFQPVRVGKSFYGDGGIRLRAPISPAIHLGAERVLAIGIRYYRPEDATVELNAAAEMSEITLADIAGVMLNAAFMDALESDAERLLRINQTLSLLAPDDLARHPMKLRKVPFLVVRPSQDLGRLASDQFKRLPRMLRHLLAGIGASEERGWDLLSYLAFDSSYTGPLLELGRADALAMGDEIREFLTSPNLRA